MNQRSNGIDLSKLTNTLDQMKQDAELGRCKFRASNRWAGQGRTESQFGGFYAMKQEMEHPKTFRVDSDEPNLIGGGESAANPVENLLAALAGCVTSSIVIHASAQGIEIREIEAAVEGDIDLNGFAGLTDAPKGFTEIRMKLTVDADADAEQIKTFSEFSPTLATVTHGTRVDLQVAGRAQKTEASAPRASPPA